MLPDKRRAGHDERNGVHARAARECDLSCCFRCTKPLHLPSLEPLQKLNGKAQEAKHEKIALLFA
jgi:hypothetical protein